MTGVLVILAFVLSGLIVGYLARVILGPTLFDRLLGLNGISTLTILLLIVVGGLYHRLEMFVDIAVGYSLLNLVGALAVSKYLERRRVES